MVVLLLAIIAFAGGRVGNGKLFNGGIERGKMLVKSGGFERGKFLATGGVEKGKAALGFEKG